MFLPTSPPIDAPAAKNGLSNGVDPSSFSRNTDPVIWLSSGSGPSNSSSGAVGMKARHICGISAGAAFAPIKINAWVSWKFGCKPEIRIVSVKTRAADANAKILFFRKFLDIRIPPMNTQASSLTTHRII